MDKCKQNPSLLIHKVTSEENSPFSALFPAIGWIWPHFPFLLFLTFNFVSDFQFYININAPFDIKIVKSIHLSPSLWMPVCLLFFLIVYLLLLSFYFIFRNLPVIFAMLMTHLSRLLKLCLVVYE